jgi:cold-inducible RNA-binding protein
MGRKLYVGNLADDVPDAVLRQMFAEHGTVQSAQVILDRDNGRSKGFGFVEMGSNQEAQAATQALNRQEVDGRALTVNEARPRPEGGGGRGGRPPALLTGRRHPPRPSDDGWGRFVSPGVPDL